MHKPRFILLHIILAWALTQQRIWGLIEDQECAWNTLIRWGWYFQWNTFTNIIIWFSFLQFIFKKKKIYCLHWGNVGFLCSIPYVLHICTLQTATYPNQWDSFFIWVVHQLLEICCRNTVLMLSILGQQRLFVQVFKGWKILNPFCLFSAQHNGCENILMLMLYL